MATARDVIEHAFRKARVFASGETPPAQDATDALTILNDMMHAFDVQGIEYAHATLALADTVNLPDSLIGPVKSMLAVRLCGEFETTPTDELRIEAASGRQAIGAYYLDNQPARVDGGLLNMPSQRRYW